MTPALLASSLLVRPAARNVVLLSEVGGSRYLPVWVGQWEGDSIALLLEKVTVPRPLTHAFTAALLRAGDVGVKHVRIHRLAEKTFYAEVVLDGTSGPSSVDTRPSDCIALALEVDAPIYMGADVLAAVEAVRSEKPMLPMGAQATSSRTWWRGGQARRSPPPDSSKRPWPHQGSSQRLTLAPPRRSVQHTQRGAKKEAQHFTPLPRLYGRAFSH